MTTITAYLFVSVIRHMESGIFALCWELRILHSAISFTKFDFFSVVVAGFPVVLHATLNTNRELRV